MKPASPFLPRLSVPFRIIAAVGLLALAHLDFVSANPAEPGLLDADQAFRVAARWHDARTVELNYLIADGYYMYRDRFGFTIDGKPVKLAKSQFPTGQIKQDPTFGRVVTYRNSVRLQLPIHLSGSAHGENGTLEIEATSQGCADLGVCYPPLRQRLRVTRGSALEVGPAGSATTTGFSRPANQGTLGDLLKKGN